MSNTMVWILLSFFKPILVRRAFSGGYQWACPLSVLLFQWLIGLQAPFLVGQRLKRVWVQILGVHYMYIYVSARDTRLPQIDGPVCHSSLPSIFASDLSFPHFFSWLLMTIVGLDFTFFIEIPCFMGQIHMFRGQTLGVTVYPSTPGWPRPLPHLLPGQGLTDLTSWKYLQQFWPPKNK